ncbi:MAG: sulfurtransferase [Hyphomicrobiales bacterium]
MDVTIDVEAVHRRLGEPGLVLVDVRGEEAWRSATIPGAVHLNVYDYFIPRSDEAGIAALARSAATAFDAIGIGQARTAIFFEDRTGMISPRGLWFHEFLGLSGGLILDGGFQAWIEAGHATAPGYGASAEILPEPPDVPQPATRRQLIASLQETLDAPIVLDVRRRSEYSGDFVHPCCARAGRIPGCRHIFWEDLLDEGRYRSPGEVAAIAAKAGLSRDQAIVTYCHRGARAATALYALRRAGFNNVRVFVGSWHEWAERADLPLETGD